MTGDASSSPPEKQAARAVEILATTFGRVHDVVVHETWGPTVVLEAAVRDAPTRVVIKASAVHDVRVEAAAARLAREADVPVPAILAEGTDASIPGGRWFAMERAPGRTWESLHAKRVDVVVLRDLGAVLRRLHGLRPSGHGPLDARGKGTFATWPAWVEQVASSAMAATGSASFDTSELSGLLRRALAELRRELELRPATLVHGDLGDREVIVDPRSSHVTAIVDWGDALVADPLYEFERFVAGGPADDPRPARFRPPLYAFYGHDPESPGARRLHAFYHAHNAIRNAAWSAREEPAWVPALLQVAADDLAGIGAD